MQNGSQSLRRGSPLWPLCLPRLPGMYCLVFFFFSWITAVSFSTKSHCPFCFSIPWLIYLLYFFFSLLSCNWCLVSPILPFITFLSVYLGCFSCYSFFMCNRPIVKTWYRRKPVDRRKRRQLRPLLLVQMDQRRALVNLRQEKMVKSPSFSTNALGICFCFLLFCLWVRICHIPTFLSRFKCAPSTLSNYLFLSFLWSF